MAAYAAVVSLKNTIENILHSSRLSLVRPYTKILGLAYKELQPLKETLERLDSTGKSRSRKKVNALDGRIKEELWKFEDLLESLLSDQIISQLESLGDRLKSRRKFNIRAMLLGRKEESHASQSRDVLSFSIDLQRLQVDVHSFIQALKVMENEYIYELDNMTEDDDDEYCLSSRACFGGMESKMIGLSDQFEQVRNSILKRYSGTYIYALVGMAGVGKTTLVEKIYEDESISSHFECRAWITVGRKPQLHPVSRGILAQLCGIAQGDDNLKGRLEGKKCLIVLDDVWEAQVLDSLTKSLSSYIQKGMMKILLTTRDRHVIVNTYDIPISKIMNMLTAEGWFLDTNMKQSLEMSVWECLVELCTWKYLLLSKHSSSMWFVKLGSHGYKSCRLHSSWRHLCRGEAWKNKFFHVLNKLVDGLEEGVKGQRSLCLQNNILFGLKEFCESVKCNCASTTRSVLFLGPYHQYPIPIDVGFKLLRELDALQLRFYTFPIEILTLIQLKYLALTCNGGLPTTISKLFNLKILIIHPHINIQCCGAPSYIPIQIWDMQELEHIEILGKSLVAPNHFVACLENLSTLVGVNANIYTILKLFKRIPHIRKLGVQIELTPYDDDSNLLSCFRCISTLEGLKTLKCSIINPVVQYGFVIPSTPSSLMMPR